MPLSNRRSMLTTTALIAPALAVAGCAQIQTLFSPANVASVEAVIAKIQAVMPYVSGIASVVGAIVPGAQAVVSTIKGAFTAASSVFATMTSTMSVASAQTAVQQIVTYASGAVTSAKSIVAALPATAQTTVNNLLAEADTVLGDLNAFVNPPTTAPTAAMIGAAPVHMFIRAPK
jgi:hypothetical protein